MKKLILILLIAASCASTIPVDQWVPTRSTQIEQEAWEETEDHWAQLKSYFGAKHHSMTLENKQKLYLNILKGRINEANKY